MLSTAFNLITINLLRRITISRRKTNSEFLKEVHQMHGNEYTVLDPYITAIIKLRFRHNKCGYVFKMTPNGFLGGHKCPKCAPSVRGEKLSGTTTSYKKKVYKVVGNKFSVIGKYVNGHTNVKIKHNVCGYVFITNPYHFLSRKKCPRCNMIAFKKRISKSNSEYRKEVYAKVGNEYTVLTKYKNSTTKVLMRHNKCHHTYWVNPNTILKGHGCPYCYGSNIVNDSIFKDRVKKLGYNKYIVLTKYINIHTKVKFKHLVCGHYFWMMPSDFTSNGHRCPKCFGHKRKTMAEFKSEVYRLVGNKYTVIGKYKNALSKILMQHNICGCVFSITPGNFLRGKRCPRCNESHGEHVVEQYLIKHHIKYKAQKRFDGCVYNHTLPFDFYLPDYHQLIEYDGYQHRHIMNFGGKEPKAKQEKELKLRIKRDHIKTMFCNKNKNLRDLLRIPTPSRNPSIDEVKKQVYKYLNEYFKRYKKLD